MAKKKRIGKIKTEEELKNGQEEGAAESSEINKSSDKQLYWVFGVMAGLIIVFLISYSVFQDLRKIEYNGLTFTKEKFGDIPLYHYSYAAKVRGITGNVVTFQNRKVDLYLRNDPRENNIPIEGEIEFPRDAQTIYVGIGDEGITGCPYSIIGLASLSSFLSQNGYSIKAGVLSKDGAVENNLEHVSCDVYPENGVITLEGGDETRITKEGKNCYKVEVSNCETLPAVEKFIVQAIVDAKERAS